MSSIPTRDAIYGTKCWKEGKDTCSVVKHIKAALNEYIGWMADSPLPHAALITVFNPS